MIDSHGRALRIAILGAESTGKTALSQALRERLARQTGLRVAGVSEWLRDWCEWQGRTPALHEQRAIAQEQQRRIEEAAAEHDIVVCDTTALMTSIYSQWYFSDTSLDTYAAAQHARSDATLLMAIDLAWQADGLQRSGEPVREPIDTLLRERLMHHRVPFSVISGQAERRVAHALTALQPLLATNVALPAFPPRTIGVGRGLFTNHLTALNQPVTAPPSGLVSTPESTLTGLATTNEPPTRVKWACECCDPAAEAASLRQRRGAEPG